jgi:hypothetical protein
VRHGITKQARSLTSIKQQPGKKKQAGLVLLVLVMILVLIASTYYFSTISITEIKVDKLRQTRQVLKKAKQALIEYAVNFPEITGSNRGPGYLPCPDLIDNGISLVNNCKTSGVPNVGRFPWRTLGTGDLRDYSNERLWYAVSENFDYSNSPTVNKINTATTGTISFRNSSNIQLNDGAGIDGIIAVIIAPGETLIRDDGVVQDRSVLTGGPNDPLNYLDNHIISGQDNASFQHNNSVNGFINGELLNGGNVVVNDIVEVITYRDIMTVVEQRVAGEIDNVLNDYFTKCGAYPDAATFTPGVGPYDSVLNLKNGLLPVGDALPLDWDMNHGSYCDLTGVKFPDWVETEEWHLNTYYEYSYTNGSFPLPPLLPNPTPAGTPCSPGIDCLVVNNSVAPIDNKNALIIFAKRITNGVRPSSTLTNYFEIENASLNRTYDKNEPEDYIRVISP